MKIKQLFKFDLRRLDDSKLSVIELDYWMQLIESYLEKSKNLIDVLFMFNYIHPIIFDYVWNRVNRINQEFSIFSSSSLSAATYYQ